MFILKKSSKEQFEVVHNDGLKEAGTMREVTDYLYTAGAGSEDLDDAFYALAINGMSEAHFGVNRTFMYAI